MLVEKAVVFLRSDETRKYTAGLLNVNYEAWVSDKFAFSYKTISERMRPLIPQIDRNWGFFKEMNLLSDGLRQGLTCFLFDIVFVMEVGCRMSDVTDLKVK